MSATRYFLALILVFPTILSAAAETWRLGEQGRWEIVSQAKESDFISAVAEFKELVSKGETAKAANALERIKQQFPEAVGEGLEAFGDAEMLYARRKFDKAAKAYKAFLDGYPRSELYRPALERLFQIGTAYLQGHKRRVLGIFRVAGYTEGAKIMNDVADRAGDLPIARRALTAVARSLQRRGKYLSAYEQWSQVYSLWPGGETGREALLGMAECMYSAYRGPKYDASCLRSARDYYRQFSSRYPEDAQRLEVDRILAEIREQIALKKYTVGAYYDRTGSELAANLYYDYVVATWPDSRAAELVAAARAR